MPPLSPTRSLALLYHVEEGAAWLAESDSGKRSTMLAYAAFELRLALERLMLEYLIRVQGTQPTAEDLHVLSSLKRAENRIYELEGHQGKIDRKFRIFEILFEMMEMPFQLARPHFGKIGRRWQECSELCHVGWSLASASNQPNILDEAFRSLSKTHDYLASHTKQLVTWPAFADPKARELEQKFIAGDATEEEMRAYFRRLGVWSRITRPDGTNEFVGKAIPPEAG